MATQIHAHGKRKRSDTELDSTSQQPKRRKLNLLIKQASIPKEDIENINPLNVNTSIHNNSSNQYFANSDNNKILSFNYQSDLDQNGLVYYLGTFNKTYNTFTNPALIGVIKTSCSNLLSNSKSSEYIISRKPQRLITKSEINSWFCIDFRPSGYEIIPHYYTLRHYNSSNYQALRNWYLKGSNDGITWYIIREHNNDDNLRIQNKSHTWNINTGMHAYSIFKIQQFGKNSGDSFCLACCGFEIYGDAKKIKKAQINQKMEANDSDSDIEILPNNPLTIPNEPDSPDTVQVQESVDNLSIRSDTANKQMAMDDNYNNHNNISTSPRQRLCNMGFDDYMVNESLKYVDNNIDTMMDWITTHEITESEELNLKITKLCNIMECEKYQSLYALKQSNNNTQTAMHKLVDANLNTSFIVNPNNTNNNNNNNNNIFDNLSNNDINNLKLEYQILSATLLSIHEERQKEQQFKKLKPIILSELRSMGFLQIAAQRALNNKLVKDKKTAIQYILNHPLNDIEEKNAKIEEIINSGYSRNDAVNALDKYSQNLNMAISWLMQGKPIKIKHFMYHVSSKHIMEINGNGQENVFCPELTENVNVKNMNQHWSFYENGKIKNFANNKILAIKCKTEENNNNMIVSYDLCLIIDDIKNNDEYKDNKENNNLGIYKYWEMDENDKIIKNKECNLYLVYRTDLKKFYLEKTIHQGDMEQRWCFIDENQLIKINPKELHRLLDSQEFECVICWENEPNIRLEPCGHSTFCRKCIDELKPNGCPICRTSIHSKTAINE